MLLFVCLGVFFLIPVTVTGPFNYCKVFVIIYLPWSQVVKPKQKKQPSLSLWSLHCNCANQVKDGSCWLDSKNPSSQIGFLLKVSSSTLTQSFHNNTRCARLYSKIQTKHHYCHTLKHTLTIFITAKGNFSAGVMDHFFPFFIYEILMGRCALLLWKCSLK